MSELELEEKVRQVCYKSGLSNTEIAGVLDMVKVGFEMLSQDEAEEE